MRREKIKKIIFVLIDTLRANSPTPNIDALGKQGVVFHNAYASITKTDPSITSIMSGKYPLSLGLVNHGRDVRKEEEDNVSNVLTLAEILKTHGFKTAAVDWFSRWHKRGYDYYSGKLVKDFASHYLVIDKLPLPFYLRMLDKATIKLIRRDFFLRFYYSFFKKPKIPYDPADVVISKSLEILNKNKKTPLFLYIHLWDPHFPHTRSKGIKSYIFDTVERTYNAEVKFVDEEFRRLISYLQKTHQLDDTLLIITSDHGENFYDNVPLNHEGLKEDVVKVPLLLRHKTLPPKKIYSLVQHVDLVPTILELLGIPKLKMLDGKSMVPLILGKEKKIRNFVYFEDLVARRIKIIKIRRRGIMIGNYKYIETLIGKNESLYSIIPGENIKVSRRELYDLKTDPLEKKNIIKEKSVVAKRLKSRLYKIISNLNAKRLGIN